MHALIGGYQHLLGVMVKTLLLFVVAALGLRLSERRTIAQLGVFDLVVTVATGAIVGRTATASTTSFVTGAAALLTLLVIHRVVAAAHRRGWLGTLVERGPLVIVAHGELQTKTLHHCGPSEGDAMRLMRQAGLHDPADAQFVLLEARGEVTVVGCQDPIGPADRAGLADAGWPDDEPGAGPIPG